MGRKILKNTEWSILICTILLIIVGLITLYSTSINSDLDAFKRQIVWAIIAIPVIIILMVIDYNFLARISPVFYGIGIISLIAVLFTSPINGARSWFELGFFSLQPAEIGKIAMVLFLSYIFVFLQKKTRKDINKITSLAIILGILMAYILLILIQPDYGTATAYMVAIVLMLFVAGIDKKYILISILLVVILVPVMYYFVLPGHAKDRIDVYLNPELDPRGAGYNIIQSKLAIGAGKLFGMGFLQGTQTHLGFLYPKTTDFIFPVIGEEFGFVACRSNSYNLCNINYKIYTSCKNSK